MVSATDQLGRVLADRYRLVELIGTGASSHVYAAEDAALSRRVAVKVLHPALASDQAFLRRFLVEAQSAAGLNHPHVLRVFDWGQSHGDGPFLVLEYLGGGSLREILDWGAIIMPEQAAAIGIQAGQALAYAHRHGIVHRDIKPANILFDEEGSLRVADFGLARALAESAWTEPVGAVLGTARYASPEQAEGRLVDDRSDVYSLALVLFEALTGWVPFAADTTVATLMARLGANLPIVPQLGGIGPILADAARPDSWRRLDASSLVERLQEAAREMPHPAPVHLVGPDRRPAGQARDVNMGFGGLGGGADLGLDLDPDEHDEAREAGGVGGAGGVLGPVPGERLGAGAHRGRTRGRGLPGEASLSAPTETLPTVSPRKAKLPGSPAGPVGATRGGPGADPGALAASGAAAASAAATAAAETALRDEKASAATRTGSRRGGDRADGADRADRADRAEAPRTGHSLFRRSGVRSGTGKARDQRSAPAGAAPPATRRRWRRRTVIIAAIVAAVAIAVTVAGLVGIEAYQATIRNVHATPRVTGLTLAAARQRAARTDLRIRVGSAAYSGSVPAGRVISQSIRPGRQEQGGTAIVVVVSKGPRPVPIPSLQGDSSGEAVSALTRGHLGYREAPAQYSETVNSGNVISWSPSGKDVLPGTVVTFVVSKGPHPRIVPTLAGDTWAQATSALQGLRLVAGEQLEYSNSVAQGKVIDTVPAAGTTVARGYTVDVVVSKGPHYVQMPSNLVGLPVQTATSELKALGLFVAGTYGPGNTVITSYPTEGSTVRVGTAVTLYTI